MNHHTFKITDEKGRLDKVLSGLMPDESRSKLQQLIEEDHILVNDQSVQAKYKVKAGDQIEVTIPEAKEISTEAEALDLDILYQDSDLAVVSKEQGMVVHPSAGHYSGTLVNALLYHLDDLSGINGEIRPGIVHRLDKDTSGLLVVAKNDQAHQKLAQQLKDRTVHREYVTLVHGKVPHQKGTIDAPIGRDKADRKKYAVVDDGKEARTHFDVLDYFGDDYTLLSCRLETGRTHQIRVHLNYIDFPVAGDPLYGPAKTLPSQGQFLHAKKLAFDHPSTGVHMTFTSDLPDYFEKTLEELTIKYK